MMKIYVISLKDAHKRRSQIARQLDNLDVSYEFFDALSGNSDIRSNANYDFAYRERMFGRQMTPGEIGCFMSHQAIWRLIAIAKEPACIMEDDVLLGDNFSEVMAKLAHYDNYDLLRLSGIFQRRVFTWQEFMGLRLVKYWRDPMGTQCYLIKPDAALKLLAKSALINAPVDDFIGSYELHGLNVIGCDPYPVLHDWETPSQLGQRHTKRAMSVGEKIRRGAVLQWRGIRCFLIQLKYYWQTILGLGK